MFKMYSHSKSSAVRHVLPSLIPGSGEELKRPNLSLEIKAETEILYKQLKCLSGGTRNGRAH